MDFSSWGVWSDQVVVIDQSIRWQVFLVLVTVLALGEALFPRRQLRGSRWIRWTAHGLLQAASVFLIQIIYKGGLVAFAASLPLFQAGCLLDFMVCGSYPSHLGILGLPLSPLWDYGLSIVILDLAIYGQHWLSHRLMWFWRLHEVHHTDRDLDFSSGFRFHPLEILVSFFYKALVIYLFNISPDAVLLYEVLLNGFALFTHANLSMPLKLDGALRFLLVTPEMHRIHHSLLLPETNSNYGNIFSIWDRLFGTYCKTSLQPQHEMAMGVSGRFEDQDINALHLGLLPFEKRSD